jgi:4a-hydroxytetrahydrobiopterin dehydratase
LKKLNTAEVQEALVNINDWHLVGDCIERTFKFSDFKNALAFVVKVGIEAEKANHHPEIWNVYNLVKLRLNTHSEQAITTKDIELATAINKIYV